MLSKEHFIGCQGVKIFFLKDPFKVSFLHKLRFVRFQVLSQFQLEFWSFIIIWVFKFYHNFSFSILSQLEFLSFIQILVEFYHNLGFEFFGEFYLGEKRQRKKWEKKMRKKNSFCLKKMELLLLLLLLSLLSLLSRLSLLSLLSLLSHM